MSEQLILEALEQTTEHVRDLPWQGRRLDIHLQTRRCALPQRNNARRKSWCSQVSDTGFADRKADSAGPVHYLLWTALDPATPFDSRQNTASSISAQVTVDRNAPM